MAVTASAIYNSFKEILPNDPVVVVKFTAPGGWSQYSGKLVLDVQLEDKDWLRVYKMPNSAGPAITSEEIKRIAFPFVYDTKGIADSNKRRESLYTSLIKLFPNHHVSVFIFEEAWSRFGDSKAYATFTKEYGSSVEIILN